MKKTLFLVLLSFLIVGGSLVALDVIYIKVHAEVANIRSEPSLQGQVIAQVRYGSILESNSLLGEWYAVSVVDAQGKTRYGFIHKNIVEVIRSGQAQPQPQPVAPPPPPPAQTTQTYQAPRYPTQKTSQYMGVSLFGGFVLSSLSLSEELPPEVDQKMKSGFSGGVAFELPFSQSFSLVLSAFYTSGGTVFDVPIVPATMTVNANVLMFPLMFKVKLIPGQVSPYITAGGTFGFSTKQEATIEIFGTVITEDISEDVEKLIFGPAFGGGVEIGLGNMRVFIEGRYYLGLSNMIKDPDPGDYARPNVINVLLGIGF
jgi:hypothetical protein